MASIDRLEVIPSARKLVNSLRNIGYEFTTAVADLVDNSLEANATVVKIEVEFRGENSFVRIVDNGKGMNIQELREAMRFGSNHDFEKEDDLGKFGLGLKTASFSQCRSFVVASRSERFKKNINAFYWDLDEIENSDKWEITKVEPGELKELIDRHLNDGPGTVVIWRKLDRILNMKYPEGEAAKKRLGSMCHELEDHLSMVFHRFLNGEVPGRTLRIYINDRKINPWDPYCRQEDNTQIFDSVKLDLNNNGKVGSITLQPYVLPHEKKFSSKDAFLTASGPKKWNRQQGFYIYRANRMIQCGGWAGIRTIDEHLKLARISLDFTSYLDDYFNLNISKMQVKLPQDVRDQINDALNKVVKQANLTYRKKIEPSNKPTVGIPSSPKEPLVSSLVNPPSPIEENPIYENNLGNLDKLWSLEEVKTFLLYFATDEETAIIDRLFYKLTLELERNQNGS